MKAKTMRGLIGKGPEEVVKEILRLKPEIKAITLIPYIYVPLRFYEPKLKLINQQSIDFLHGNMLNNLDRKLPKEY